VGRRGLGNRGLRRCRIGNITDDGDAADLGGNGFSKLFVRSQTATFAPCAASRRALAAPNPDAPPVTTAAWSFSCMVFSLTNSSSN